MDSSKLVWGPPADNSQFGDVTLSKLLYNSLREKQQSDILLIEESTGEEISRGDLLKKAIKLSTILQELGISEYDTIGIITPNTWKFSIPVLAGIFIGVPVSPINPSSSKDDLCHYLKLSKPKILFVSHLVLNKIRIVKTELEFVKHVIVLDSEDVEDDELVLTELLSREINFEKFKIYNDKSGEALILYSSGTTGFPKGLILTQDNVLNCLKYCCNPNYLDINEDSIMVGILPLFHIFGIVLLLSHLWNGKRIIFSSKFKPETFLKTIETYKVTNLMTVPPLLLFLAKSPMVDDYDMSSITHIYCGAAPLGKEVENIVAQRFKIPVRQLYGLSECAAVTITPPCYRKPGSVGRVVPGHHAKIIDPDSGKLLGRNTNGEICFKGPCVMKGYIDNEEETRKTIDEDRYLHTGDIGYFDDDGFLFILDRIKDIIKYKGFQVPPAQLEDILKKHPAVKDAAVVGKPDEGSGELPTAFVVCQTNAHTSENEIMDYIAERVSTEKQLRGGVIFIDEIPQTTSGKILKRQLQKLLV